VKTEGAINISQSRNTGKKAIIIRKDELSTVNTYTSKKLLKDQVIVLYNEMRFRSVYRRCVISR